MRSAWSMSSQKMMVLDERVGRVEEFHDALGDQLGALVEDEDAVHVLLVVFALLDLLTQVIVHARRWRPALDVLVDVDAHHLVGREKAVFDALLEAVGVNRLAEVGDVGNVFGFLRCGGHAELNGAVEVFEDFTPGGIVRRTAAMTFVDDDQVEEVARDVS